MSRPRRIENQAVAKILDHTVLGHKATEETVLAKAKEALGYNFASLCVPPTFVSLVKNVLEDSTVKVCTVIGFPLGSHTTSTKEFEATKAIEDGAHELDVVVNVSQLLSGNRKLVKEEIQSVTELIHRKGCIVKWIFEISALDEEDVLFLCDCCVESKVDFAKTSTGFGASGARKEIVSLMYRRLVGKVKIKASGGIRTLKQVEEFYEAGADRIGSSSGVNIMKEIK